MKSWEYAKDGRSENQIKKDYTFGKKNETQVLEASGFRFFLVNSKDEFGTLSDYVIDAFVLVQGHWWPVEVKYTPYKLDYVELKQNQARSLADIGGLYLQDCKQGYFIINAHKMMRDGEYTEESYCNKPCYRVEVKEWRAYKRRVQFFGK